MIPCLICNRENHETCGCWETIEEIPITDEELAIAEKTLYRPTMQ